MAIVRWDPFQEFRQLEDRINRVFHVAYAQPTADASFASGTWVPPVDIYQNGDHELVLTAELPAMSRDDIEITVENQTLTIKGEKKPAADVKEEQRHRSERRYGPFSRSFSLPLTVESRAVAAEFRNGVLTVRLPLREEAKPRQIKIDAAA
jgi:HSP20 family protein